jgi:hypothetical protein
MFREMVHFVIDRGFSDPWQPEVHRSSTGSASSFEANYHLFPLRKVSMVCVVGDRDARWNIRAVVHRVHWTGRVGFESHGIDAFFWTLASGKFVQSLDDTFLFEVDRDGASRFGERNYDAVPHLERFPCRRPDLHDLTHGLMAHDVAGFHAGHEMIVEVQVRAADAQLVTLMMTSRSCSILGSGTLSQRMSVVPCQTSAFIATSAA